MLGVVRSGCGTSGCDWGYAPDSELEFGSRDASGGDCSYSREVLLEQKTAIHQGQFSNVQAFGP